MRSMWYRAWVPKKNAIYTYQSIWKHFSIKINMTRKNRYTPLNGFHTDGWF